MHPFRPRSKCAERSIPAHLYTRFPDGAVAALADADGVHEWPVAVVALGNEDPAIDATGPAVEGRIDGDPVQFPLVTACAMGGDPTAMALLERIGYWLGIGIASLANLFEPEVVVVGGGLGGTGNKLLFGPARSTFESYLFGRRHRRDVPSIVPALLGANAGLMGAAAIALEEAAR